MPHRRHTHHTDRFERSTSIDGRVWAARGMLVLTLTAIGIGSALVVNEITHGKLLAAIERASENIWQSNRQATHVREDILALAAVKISTPSCTSSNSAVGRQLVATLKRDHHAFVTITLEKQVTRDTSSGIVIQVNNAPARSNKTFQFNADGVLTDTWEMRGTQMVIFEDLAQQTMYLTALQQQIIDACRDALAKTTQIPR